MKFFVGGFEKEATLSQAVSKHRNAIIAGAGGLGIGLGTGHALGTHSTNKKWDKQMPDILTGSMVAGANAYKGGYPLTIRHKGVPVRTIRFNRSEGAASSGEEKTAFEVGFGKKAGLLETHRANSVVDAFVGRLPLGTTISTIAGDRPAEHSRFAEWASRVGGGVAGGLVGAAIGVLPGALMRNRTAMELGAGAGATTGAMIGEGVGSHFSTSEHYDEKGRKKKGR